MKKQLLYIHGGDSYSRYEDFLADLRTRRPRNLPNEEKKEIWAEKLEEELVDYEVFKPAMPNKQNARYEEWKIWLERHFEFLDNGVTVLGWSLGAMFLAKYLSENQFPVKIKALYLLAGPGGNFALKEGNVGGDCADFRFNAEDFGKIKDFIPSINIWHSTDDFVVPFVEFDFYKKALPSANFREFSDKNHFLVEDLPELWAEFKK